MNKRLFTFNPSTIYDTFFDFVSFPYFLHGPSHNIYDENNVINPPETISSIVILSVDFLYLHTRCL